jgi:uncharacterized lipoprotein YmbA
MRLLPVLVAAALLLQACGSSKPRLKPHVFTTEAAKVCRSTQARSGALPRPASPGDVPLFLRRAARVLRTAVGRLEALRPPAQLDARWRRQTALLGRQLDIILSLSHSVHDGKGDAVGAVLRMERSLRSSRRTTDAGWQRLGIPGCVSG